MGRRVSRGIARLIASLMLSLGMLVLLGGGGWLWYQATRDPGATPTGTASINLAWDRSPSDRVAGYRILAGPRPGHYVRSVDVGNRLSATLAGLETGIRIYVVVVAVDHQGGQSPPSNEVEVVAPK